MNTGRLVCLLLVALSLLAMGCPDTSRSKFKLTYELAGGSLFAPSLSSYFGSDGVDDCEPGEVEVDYGLLYSYQIFSPSFETGLRFQPFAACKPDDVPRYFVDKDPETVFTIGQDLGGYSFGGVFETRLAGRFAMSAGYFQDGTDGIVVSERTGVGSWTHTRVLNTGSVIGSATYDSITGVDFKWTGSDVSLALTYRDDMGGSRLAYCPSLVCANAFGPGDLSGAVDYFSPRIGGLDPNAFLAFQTSAQQFGLATRLYYSDVSPSFSGQVIAELGDAVPELAGETFQSFGNFTSHQAGITLGAFTATTTPSSFSVGLSYDVADNLSLGLRYKTLDDLPDTDEVGSSYSTPAFDGDHLSIRAQTSLGKSLYLTDLPDASGSIRVGYARTDVEAGVDYELSGTAFSNESVVDQITAFKGDLLRTGGTVPAIAIQNIERVEIVRGVPATVYGSDAVAGVVNFVTRSPDGFHVEPMGTTEKDFGGATFDVDERFYVGARLNGNFYRWNDVTEQLDLLGDTGIGGFSGLSRDGSGGFYGITSSTAYQFDGIQFPATLLGSVQDDQAQPVTDLSGLHFEGSTLYASRQNGVLGQLDIPTLTFTPMYSIVGLPAALESITTDGTRAFGGLGDGRLVEFLDCPLDLPLSAAVEGAPEDYAFTALGRSGTSPVTALAVMVPEPSAAATAAAALSTLGFLRRRASRRTSRPTSRPTSRWVPGGDPSIDR